MIDRESNLLICLNPTCGTIVRIFQSHELDLHRKCIDWVIDSSLKYPQMVGQQRRIENEEVIQFGRWGINSVLQMMEIKDWPGQLQQIFESLKHRIGQQIDHIKNQKIKQFQTIFQHANLAYEELKYIIRQVYDQKLTQIKQPEHLWNLAHYQSITLYQESRAQLFLQSAFVEDIKRLGELVQAVGHKNIENSLQRSKQQAHREVYQYFDNFNISVNDKIQKLTTLHGVEMVKANFDNQASIYKSKCWLCHAMCQSNKSDNTKLRSLQQLLAHLLTKHDHQIMSTFVNKVLRYDVFEIEYNTFVDKIKYSYVPQVLVIDRENAGLVEKPIKISQQTEWIEVVNKNNKNLAKGMFIVAQSNGRDAADILITTLIYEMCKYNVQQIVLVTKDHFGITLQEIIKKLFNKKIECIEPKDMVQYINKSAKIKNNE